MVHETGSGPVQPSAALAPPTGLAHADTRRREVSRTLDSRQRSRLGQYMTPAPVARFLASLFTEPVGQEVHLLDAGAGLGALTAAFVDRMCGLAQRPARLRSTLYEIDPGLVPQLRATLATCEQDCQRADLDFTAQVRVQDFIQEGAARLLGPLFDTPPETGAYTHAILNPPYHKIRHDSAHRRWLRAAGIETGNLYTGFLALALLQLAPQGELVAIVPRSWCNGPYYRPFRQLFLGQMQLRQVHLFASRRQAFRDDAVLQENVILHAVRTRTATAVRLTASSDSTWSDLTERICQPQQIVDPEDPNLVLHLAPDLQAQHVLDRMAAWPHTLAELGLQVSTGPVVHFRVRKHLRPDTAADTAPLVWPGHIRGARVAWAPGTPRKPAALVRNSETVKWLYPRGTYTLVRRFSAKEERRRIVAGVLEPAQLQGSAFGFENHLNVFHQARHGLEPALARGLAAYLNTSLVDAWFRQFSGHTQVNATDLRALRYPSRADLVRLGQVQTGPSGPERAALDQLLERTLQHMATISSPDPIRIQTRIAEALAILKELGLPRGQLNDRSALALLALLDLRPEQEWPAASAPLIGVTPIMNFCRTHYGRDYAPNTRETFRRQSLHQFVQAGLVVMNPDQPDRATNSPDWCYQIEPQALALCQIWDTPAWDQRLVEYLRLRPSLQAQYAKQRTLTQVPVTLPGGQELALSTGAHSELMRDIVTRFAPRFVPGGKVLYLGDTQAKADLWDTDAFAALNLHFDTHGKMPDVVLHYPAQNWLLLVEAVTSHGPMDAKRRVELAQLCQASTAGLLYVTAFPSRKELGQYLAAISWETEVWVAADPDHLIHFDGTRFLGPYPE